VVNKSVAALAAAVIAFAVSPAYAAIYDFSFSGRDGTATFAINSTTGTAANAGQVDFNNVAGSYAGTLGASTTASEIVFGIPYLFAGIVTITPADFQILGSSVGAFEQFSGPALFSGTSSDPIFNVGTFKLTSLLSGNATLTISQVAAVPEPSTWAMMILGFFSVGFMAYRRKQGGQALRLI
jgi:PEP-CTERM motif